MARTADHADRRRHVIRIARRISLQRGLDAMTVRAIARETGYSTAIVSYYFKDKHELSMLVFEEALAISLTRFRDTVDAGQPLIDCLCSLLPVDDDLRDVWRTWFAFWSLTVSDTQFRAAQIDNSERLIATLRDLIARESHCAPDGDTAARRLFAAVLGISVQAVHDPDRWPAGRQRSVLEMDMRAVLASS